VVSGILSFYNFAMFALVIYNIIKIHVKLDDDGKLKLPDTDFYYWIVVSILVITIINLGLFFLLLIIHIPTHCTFVGKLLWNTTSYLCYTGAFSHTMVIHSFCNVDDVS
jgi:hypothetical protein